MFVGGVWMKDDDNENMVSLIILDFLGEGITNIIIETTKIPMTLL